MIYVAVALFLNAFALLQFNSSESLLLWKLSIVATEYGHWLAIVPLALLVTVAMTAPAHAASSGSLYAIASALLLWPAFQYGTHAGRVAADLNAEFGVDGEAPGLTALWSTRVSAVAPRKLSYRSGADLTLTMDHYPARGTLRTPWVMVVHGGGWDSGDAKQLPELNAYLADRGYTVFAIEYRLAPRWRWPAPREDVLDAITYVKAHAAELNVDPARFVLLGRSAGGQIAEAVGLAARDPGLRGIIAFYAPSDMNVSFEWGREDDILASRELVRRYMGGEPAQLPELYRDASPTTFVSASAPPTLLFHGPRDPLVSVRHSRDLSARLRAAGAKSLTIEIPWATHGFDYNLVGPGGQISTFSITTFLKRVFA